MAFLVRRQVGDRRNLKHGLVGIWDRLKDKRNTKVFLSHHIPTKGSSKVGCSVFEGTWKSSS